MSAKKVRFTDGIDAKLPNCTGQTKTNIEGTDEGMKAEQSSLQDVPQTPVSPEKHETQKKTRTKKKKTELQKLTSEKRSLQKEIRSVKKNIKEDSKRKESEDYSPFENRQRLARSTSELHSKLVQLKDEISVKHILKKEKTKKANSLHTNIKKKSIRADKQHSRIITMTGKLERMKIDEEELRSDIVEEMYLIELQEKVAPTWNSQKHRGIASAHGIGLSTPASMRTEIVQGNGLLEQQKIHPTWCPRQQRDIPTSGLSESCTDRTSLTRTSNDLERPKGQVNAFSSDSLGVMTPIEQVPTHEWIRMPCSDMGPRARRLSSGETHSANKHTSQKGSQTRGFDPIDEITHKREATEPDFRNLNAGISQPRSTLGNSAHLLEGSLGATAVHSAVGFEHGDENEAMTSSAASWRARSAVTSRMSSEDFLSVEEKKLKADKLAKKYEYTRELRNTIHEHMISRSYSYSYLNLIPPYKPKKQKPTKAKQAFNRAIYEDKMKVTEFSQKYGSATPKIST